eukprot:TRINITY_DN57070_c0_g1_i1.p1 TRINITY_DN57070_c0_g1~~TRINITY_DN57070_c0_g1_i1.p1  ORF type:complete len:472 (+),score=74.63 TRINITY_DN57070_c0_g1_i1:40-1416(+)
MASLKAALARDAFVRRSGRQLAGQPPPSVGGGGTNAGTGFRKAAGVSPCRPSPSPRRRSVSSDRCQATAANGALSSRASHSRMQCSRSASSRSLHGQRAPSAGRLRQADACEETPRDDLADASEGELRSEVARLREALEMATRCTDAMKAEVAMHNSLLVESEAQHALEESSEQTLLGELSYENTRLQNESRLCWSSARRMSATLRLHDDQVAHQTEEVMEIQKRLEQENARLRKEAAAMRARLLGWSKQRKKSMESERTVVQRAPTVCYRSLSPTYVNPAAVASSENMSAMACSTVCGSASSNLAPVGASDFLDAVDDAAATASSSVPMSPPTQSSVELASPHTVASSTLIDADVALSPTNSHPTPVVPGLSTGPDEQQGQPEGAAQPLRPGDAGECGGAGLQQRKLSARRLVPPLNGNNGLSPAALEAAQVSSSARLRAKAALAERGVDTDSVVSE